MYKVKETIIVEGTYDKIKLSGFVDGVILTTNGFTVFRDSKLLESIKSLAKKTGIVILTDADSAGFKIRNFIKQSIESGTVLHAYIPDVKGKERRNRIPGKEGLLGVEGIDEETIINALKKAGCTIDGGKESPRAERKITKADMYAAGFSGGTQSALLRKKAAQMLGIPSKISANMLTDVINRLLTYDEFCEMAEKIKSSLSKDL